MRAVFFFLVAAVLLLAFTAPAVSAQRERNVTWISFYNDSSCMEHIETDNITLPSSTKCVPEGYGLSLIFTCTTTNNKTDFNYGLYADNDTCSTAPIVSMTSSAPAHTCAPLTVTSQGQSETYYAHIRCEEERAAQGVMQAVIRSALESLGLGSKVEKPTVPASGFIADQMKAGKRKARSAKLLA